MWTKPLAGFGSALAPSGAGPKPGTNFQHEVLVAIARTASKTCASAILVQNPPENALDGPTWTHIKQGSIQQVSGNLDPRAKRASTGRPENENATQRDGALDRCRPAAFEHSRQIRVSSPSRVAVSRLESASRVAVSRLESASKVAVSRLESAPRVVASFVLTRVEYLARGQPAERRVPPVGVPRLLAADGRRNARRFEGRR